MLVPTTILAQQHFGTFSERLKDYPFTIEHVSRFRSPADQKKAIEGFQSGRVDILIGTHRILSRDVSREGPRPDHRRRGAALRPVKQKGAAAASSSCASTSSR